MVKITAIKNVFMGDSSKGKGVKRVKLKFMYKC